MEIRIGLGLGGEEKKRPGPECRNWPPFETPSPVDMDFWQLHGLVSWLAIVARRSVDMAWVWRTLGRSIVNLEELPNYSSSVCPILPGGDICDSR